MKLPGPLRPALAAGLLASLVASASAAPAQDLFLDISLEEVLARAAAEQKIVLLAFYQDGCDNCDKMDRLTLTDTQLRNWMVDSMLAIRIDPDQEQLCADYGIRTRPTYLFVDAQGGVLDRIEGFRKPGAFRRLAKISFDGGGLVQCEREVAESPDDPAVHLKYARTLSRRQMGLEAIEQFLWVYDNTRGDPEWAERRLDEVLRGINVLRRTQSEARRVLVKRRDLAAAALIEDYDPEMPESLLLTYANELRVLNQFVTQPDNTVFAWNVLTEREGVPASVTDALFTNAVESQFIEQERYDELLELWGDPLVIIDGLLAELQVLKARAAADPSAKINVERARSEALEQTRKYYEVLLLARREQEARDVEALMIGIEPVTQTFTILVSTAFRAERVELAESLIETAKETIPPGKARDRMTSYFLRLRNSRLRALEAEKKKADEADEADEGAGGD